MIEKRPCCTDYNEIELVSPKHWIQQILSLHFFTHWGVSLEKYSTTFLNIPHIHAKPQPLVSASWSLNQPTCQPLQWLSTTGFKIVTVLQLSTTGCYNVSYHIHSIPDKKNPHHDHPMYFYREGRKVKTQFHGCDLVYVHRNFTSLIYTQMGSPFLHQGAQGACVWLDMELKLKSGRPCWSGAKPTTEPPGYPGMEAPRKMASLWQKEAKNWGFLTS